MSELIARVKSDNPDPRVACVLLLDTSGSMDGVPIEELNAGFDLFTREIKQDPLAKKRTEVTVITFGGVARVEIPFTEGRDLEPRTFVAGGSTPMGAALNLAMDEIQAQKDTYRAAGLEYFRPWLFIVSDGAPTDGETFGTAAARVHTAENAKQVSVFAVGVGDEADFPSLEVLSTTRKPARLKGYSFAEMFSWLSASMAVVSDSNTFGASDGDITQAGEQLPLPPVGWATV